MTPDDVPTRYRYLHLRAQAGSGRPRAATFENRDQIVVSVLTEAELRTGAAKSSSPIKTLRLVENFLHPLAIVDFTSDDVIAYAQVRAKLERAGTPIGPLDTLIAAQAVARELTLVTNNEREFRRVASLHVENWAR